jgi:hypothetical protein
MLDFSLRTIGFYNNLMGDDAFGLLSVSWIGFIVSEASIYGALL